MQTSFAQWNDYLIDAAERSLLFLDTQGQQTCNQIDKATHPANTVLHFAANTVLDGRTFNRPINYFLQEIIPPEEYPRQARKRPYIIADPRAGQCAGIGGFKPRSEIGDAVRNGHPAYLLAFSTLPEPTQTCEDILDGQRTFFDWVQQQHPDSLPPAAIGNCAAGYPTLITASLYPESFGPIMIAGSPVSFWNGARGQYPMRYTAGLTGGVWMTELLCDLGNGRFDGAWLILNFDLLGISNFLWGKQYDLYRAIDRDQQRYLAFEKWWGDYCLMNKQEILHIVNTFFIGNRLTSGQSCMPDGRAIDLRNVGGPIVILGSSADNISPPGQSVAWIADLYRDDEDLLAQDKTVVYILNQHYGHLAQFVSSAVGEREDQAVIDLMANFEMLPAGLYELEVDMPDQPGASPVSHIKRRSIADLKTMGYNTQADNRAFAAVANASAIGSALYQASWAPWARMIGNELLAEHLRAMHPLRLDRLLYAPWQPWMQQVRQLASRVEQDRHPVAEDNIFWQWQAQLGEQISNSLQSWQDWHDQLCEQTFWTIWGNPWVQACFGVTPENDPRPVPADKTAAQRQQEAQHRAWLDQQFEADQPHAGVLRALAYAIDLEDMAQITLAEVFRPALLAHGQDIQQIKAMMRQLRTQFGLLRLDRARALAALPSLLASQPTQVQCRQALLQLADATEAGDIGIHERISQLLLMLPQPASPNANTKSGKTGAPKRQARNTRRTADE